MAEPIWKALQKETQNAFAFRHLQAGWQWKTHKIMFQNEVEFAQRVSKHFSS